MADIGISSNCVLRHFNAVPNGDDSGNSLLGDECHTTNKCNSHSKDINDEDNTSEKLIIPEYKPENESKPHSEPSQSIASSSKELPGDNHSVWLSSAIKSEIEEPEEIDTGSGEDEGSEYEEEKEEKMEEESDSEDDDDSEGGAYHLAEVSYGEEDEQDSVKREKGESESILGISQDVCKTTNPEYSDLKSSNNSSKKRSSKNTDRKNGETISLKSGKVEPENFVCSICGHMAISRASLVEHMHKHTKENVQFCVHCNKIFRHRSNLIQHIMTKHTDTAQFKCDVCGLAFAKNSVFLRHQRTHTGERPFACTLCSYRSKNAGCLKDHMRKHTGEKPYACKHCDYTCSYSSMLSRHIAAQHEKKTFVCNCCDYKTNLIRNLTKHSKKHEAAQELACEKCDFTSLSKDKLKKHIINKHLGGVPTNYYVCSFCQTKYREQKSLKRHMLKIHKTDPQGIKFERALVLTGKATRVIKPSPE